MRDFVKLLSTENGRSKHDDADAVVPVLDLRANGFAPSKLALRRTAKGLGTGRRLKGCHKLVPSDGLRFLVFEQLCILGGCILHDF